MARDLSPTTRLSRREGVNLMLKPIRDHSGKHPLEREYKNYPPGVHIFRRSKSSDYGVRLREKQKVKRHYGILEKQFRRYFEEAEKSRDNTGVALLVLLERRLDNVVYKTRFIAGRRGARQAIVHGHIYVNGHKCDRPGYQVKVGDRISISPREKSQKHARAQMQLLEGVPYPQEQEWLDIDNNNLTATVAALPQREDVMIPVEEQLIVEFCSR